ncbi:MAG: tetratricopeptide repeat protein [Polyangiales bacterium]|nr:tetratricopeptide repeat protein [Myxococcales bacterium]MCB9623904.1 tetratricopeptide repeat protein [Sandaracinus sp.]
MKDRDDNVIHVVFGGDGGYRIVEPAPEPEPEPAREDRRVTAEPRSDDPLADLYDRAEVARLFDLEPNLLRNWDRSGIVTPSARRGRRRLYSFQDLIAVRVVKGLLEAGVSQRDVRRSVDALRSSLPKVVRPLAELRVVAEGHAMVVRAADAAYEPATGQLVLDFRVDALREDVVRSLRREPSREDRRRAYDAYLEGCRLDESRETWGQAEAAYLEALRLDPSLSNAFTNLGNLRFRQGDVPAATALYEKALVVDPDQPEALYNLGFLEVERGHVVASIDYFERALEADPAFSDAHFHLASAYDRLSRFDDAAPHWEAYLELEPEGEWADVARARLKQR